MGEQHLWEKSYPHFMSWNFNEQVRPVQSLLSDAAEKYGSNSAFNFMGKKYTWAEIDALSNKLAKGLQKSGLKKGDRVGLFLPNCPYFLISYYAILKAGGTVVNYNPLYAHDEVKHQIKDSGTKYMITADLAQLYDKLEPMLDETDLEKVIVTDFADMLPFPKKPLFKVVKAKERAKIDFNNEAILHTNDLTKNDGKYDDIDINPKEDLAVLQYTGGTTGVPKGAMLTHSNVYSNTLQVERFFGDIEYGKEKMVGVLPFFHVFAMTAVMNISVRCGMEINAIPRFDLDDTLKLIDKQKPTFFPAVPAIYTAMNNHKSRDKYDLSSIKYCISGGAALPVKVKETFEAATGCVLVEGYGLTETSPVLCINPTEGDVPAGSIGVPIAGTDIKLFDPETGKEVGLGEKGELCAKGPQVMKGYLNKQEESAGVFNEQGYLRTGDIAIMDENGFFFIVDRLKDMIITNGYNVYPRHVEEAIYKHPAIEECIVAGLPDENRGEIVKVWVKLKDGKQLSEEELRSFLSDKLSKIEQPRKYEFRDEPLPKTMIGKLDKKAVLANG